MDSDESSASNTSNSSYSSHPSSPTQIQVATENDLDGSTQSCEGRESQINTISSSNLEQISKSDTDSSSSSSSSTSSSDNENDGKDIPDGSDDNTTPKEILKRSSSRESNQFELRSLNKSRSSSRKCSTSSNESHNKSDDQEDGDLNISHEDLSDISDNEIEKRQITTITNIIHAEDVSDVSFSNTKISSRDEGEGGCVEPDFEASCSIKDRENNGDFEPIYSAKNENCASNDCNSSNPLVEMVKPHDEDALDFEAEEGECADICKEEENEKNDDSNKNEAAKSDGEAEDGEELEEGEVSDEEEKRPEENEPKPVCRFYTRGQCTWGMSCRFLHPGVTDKGNYTMFENMVRSVPVAQSNVGIRGTGYVSHGPEFHEYRSDRPAPHHRGGLHPSTSLFPPHTDTRNLITDVPVVVENAWERGLRTAKEMMRKANKRKEQDMDFDEKKMNLALSPDDVEKDSYYIKERERNSPPEYNMYSPPDRFGRSVHGPVMFDEIDPYGRSARYRELPPHRMPHYEDERRVRPTREVIVQRVEPAGRGDEWNDPWMRSKSPGPRGGSRDRSDKRRRDHHSYSSNSSYSTSSSSQSDSSSDSSGSPSPPNNRRRYPHISPTLPRRQGTRIERSPSVQHRRGRHSPSTKFSPSKKHGKISPVTKRTVFSPAAKRKKLSPYVNKKLYSEKSKTKRRQATSSSGSSTDSSASDSDSDSGSSSTESSHSRKLSQLKRSRMQDKVLQTRKHARKPDASQKRSPISIEIKKPMTVGTSALVSPTNSLSSEKDNKKSRREELLKQLRAVEDAIAKKRSKLT